MTDTPKYIVTLVRAGVDQEEEINANLTYAAAIAWATQYLDHRFDGPGFVDTITYEDTCVQLWKQGEYLHSCYIRPQD